MSLGLITPFIPNTKDDLEEKSSNFFSSKKNDNIINDDSEYSFLLTENLVKIYHENNNQDEIRIQKKIYDFNRF